MAEARAQSKAAARDMKRKTLQDALKRFCVQRERARRRGRVQPAGAGPPSVRLRQVAAAGRHSFERPAAQEPGEGAIGLPRALVPSPQERRRGLVVRAAATGAGCNDHRLYAPRVTRWQITFASDCSTTPFFSTPRRRMHGARAWKQAVACHDAPRAKWTHSADAAPVHGRQWSAHHRTDTHVELVRKLWLGRTAFKSGLSAPCVW